MDVEYSSNLVKTLKVKKAILERSDLVSLVKEIFYSESIFSGETFFDSNDKFLERYSPSDNLLQAYSAVYEQRGDTIDWQNFIRAFLEENRDCFVQGNRVIGNGGNRIVYSLGSVDVEGEETPMVLKKFMKKYPHTNISFKWGRNAAFSQNIFAGEAEELERAYSSTTSGVPSFYLVVVDTEHILQNLCGNTDDSFACIITEDMTHGGRDEVQHNSYLDLKLKGISLIQSKFYDEDVEYLKGARYCSKEARLDLASI